MPTKASVYRPRGSPSSHNRHKHYDSWRGSARSRGYDSAWERVRLSHLKGEPLCRRCWASGVIKPADVVDHIVPVKVDHDRRLDDTNLQSLCNSCHTIKTNEDRKRYGYAVSGGGV
jgi:5-methylcytosine-specific restriction protein A